jgi:ribA/ribD-fused uncharacterized protein
MRITDKFVFFYTTQDCMSNFYPANFNLNGINFTCTEQHMMYSKAKLFGDEQIANQILATNIPGKIKGLGRKVTNFDETKWQQNREIILFEGNLAKFTQNIEIKNQLLSTNPKTLVEASPTDKIYGVGLSIDDSRIDDPNNWKGLNLLGEILMRVREHIIKNNL